MKLKTIAELITPPLIVSLAKRISIARKDQKEWEYVPEGWAYSKIHPEVKGWNVQEVLETYKKKWPRFLEMANDTDILGFSHESELKTNDDIISHNTVMSFAYSLSLSARNKNKLSILDWGGGIGHYYVLIKTLLPNIEIDYNCKDVPLLSNYGAKLFPKQNFYDDESCFIKKYDFVFASTSIQYTENWQYLVRRLATATKDFLYIANLPIIMNKPSFVFVQRPYQYGYNTEYLAWCLNQSEFLNTIEETGFCLQRKFVYGHSPFIHGAPEQNVYYGYLFKRILNEND